MILRAYTIFDTKALQYHPPYYQSTDGAAVRMLSDLVNNPDNNIGRHPADYVLYCCGTFDDNKGAFAPLSPLMHVMDAVSLVRLQPDLPLQRPNGPLVHTDQT